jgi:hypothetical protein
MVHQHYSVPVTLLPEVEERAQEHWQALADRVGVPVIAMVTMFTGMQHTLNALCKTAGCEWGGTFTPRGESDERR